MTAENQSGARYRAEEDPNWIEYQRALAAGEFADLDPNTYLVYSNGQLIGSGPDRQALLDQIYADPDHEKDVAIMIAKAEPDPPRELHGFFVDADGESHRGVPIITLDEEGNEKVMGLDFHDHTAYPLPTSQDAQD